MTFSTASLRSLEVLVSIPNGESQSKRASIRSDGGIVASWIGAAETSISTKIAQARRAMPKLSYM
jgi:hypothetical protein